MISTAAIKKSLIKAIKTKFKYNIYGIETVEGYEKPCFFVRLLPIKNTKEMKNLYFRRFSVVITYLQSIVDELDALNTADELLEIFLPKLHCQARYLNTMDFTTNFVGEYSNIPQYSFAIEFYDADKEINENLIEEVETTIGEQ